MKCINNSCDNNRLAPSLFCPDCYQTGLDKGVLTPEVRINGELPMAQKYPKYFKDVSNLKEVDVYAVHQLFNIQDPSGCIQHASKKLLLSGVRTGGKSARKDIEEARDTLTRYLALNPQTE